MYEVQEKSGCKHVLTGRFVVKPSPPCNLNVCTESDIRASFENSYDLNESLFTTLKDDSVFYKCPDRLRLPLIFYYGHTASVYVNKLRLAGLLQDRLDFAMETMFETGVDEMSWDDTENYRMGGSYKWPAVSEVVDYRRKVRLAILDIIDSTPLQLPITTESPWWALMMGIDHERIHIETSSVLIRQLPVDLVQRDDAFVYAPIKHGSAVRDNPMVLVHGGAVTYGKPENFPSFGWDNEYGRVQTSVPQFECSQHLITNRQFLAFVRDGGYNRRELWSEEGWNWVQFRRSRHPVFWVCENGCISSCGADLSAHSHCKAESIHNITIADIIMSENGDCVDADPELPDQQDKFRYRAMFDVLEMPMDWPVEVNYLEAKAFCAWLGNEYRLPTEAEYQYIRGTASDDASSIDSSRDLLFTTDVKANINLKFFSSTPVNFYPCNGAGFTDAHGNVWQWMEDDFNGLPGFETNFLYDDFSTPCFDGKHSMILGGSWVSTGDLTSTFARYAFRRHFVQHAGFRVCRNTPSNDVIQLPVRLIRTSDFSTQVRKPNLDMRRYHVDLVPTTNSQLLDERSDRVTEKLSREYNGGTSLAEQSYGLMTQYRLPTDKVLVVGCGTGRISFDLSKHFTTVIAIDYCEKFIAAAEQIKNDCIVRIPGQADMKLDKDVKPNAITFKQFTWIPNEMDFHKLVIFTSVDRVTNPRAYFVRFPELVLPGGLLIVSSEGQWTEERMLPHLRTHFSLLGVIKEDDSVTTYYLRNDLK